MLKFNKLKQVCRTDANAATGTETNDQVGSDSEPNVFAKENGAIS